MTPKRIFHAFFLALFLLVQTHVALASNLQPLDVTSNPALVAPTYKAGTALNTFGASGSATTPDVPPYFSFLPADVPTPNFNNWTVTINGVGSYVDCSNLAVTCEAKARLILNGSHVLYDDPGRNARERGKSHCHEFSGNTHTNGDTTYSTSRAQSESWSTGGRLNASNYWVACWLMVNAFGDGKNYALKTITGLYYAADNSTSQWLVPLFPTFFFVGGHNPDDPEDTQIQREVLVANAQASTAGRYTYPGDGVLGFQCLADVDGSGNLTTLTGARTFNGLSYVPYLNSTTGKNLSDPFLGNCKQNATSGKYATILFEMDGIECWNGKNGWTAGGTRHVRLGWGDSQLNAARVQRACPDTWYHLPILKVKSQVTVGGWSTYSRITFASDYAYELKLNSLPLCTTDGTGNFANAPCATRGGAMWNTTTALCNTGSHPAVLTSPNGNGCYIIAPASSGHFDYEFGWDGKAAKLWLAHCLGVRNLYDGDGNMPSTTGTLIPSTPNTCEPGVLNPNGASTLFMLSGKPPSNDPQGKHRNPIVDNFMAIPPIDPAHMYRVRDVDPAGTHDMQMH
jgi:hypothetical protein